VINIIGQSASIQKVLVVIAHPDDETLGAGGTIARLTKLGYPVYVASLTNGVGARGWGNSESLIRKKHSMQAAARLGFTWVYQGEFPDNSMDSVPFLDIVRAIEKVKMEIEPEIVFTHSSADLNIDHRIVASAVMTAWRPSSNSKNTDLIAMEIPSATDFAPNGFFGSFSANYCIEITDTWEDKSDALQCYIGEIQSSPNSRSLSGIDALSILRGHQVGVERAEAFEIIRKIDRA
jgi:LmbE family N-acetylglucosaminyl deacetylase